MGVLNFWFWSLCFWNMSFFVFILDTIFCGTIFFVFQDIVWLVKSFWYVHCCSIHQVYCVCGRCRSEFALWWFFVRKSFRHSTGSFYFFLVLTTRHSLSFHKFERQRCFFGVDNALFTCYWYLGRLSFWFQFFFYGIMSFYVSIHFPFSIFDHSVWLILDFWCAHFYSFIQFYCGSGRCTSEFALECFCLNKVITNW